MFRIVFNVNVYARSFEESNQLDLEIFRIVFQRSLSSRIIGTLKLADPLTSVDVSN